jgi:hypothetical protein
LRRTGPNICERVYDQRLRPCFASNDEQNRFLEAERARLKADQARLRAERERGAQGSTL